MHLRYLFVSFLVSIILGICDISAQTLEVITFNIGGDYTVDLNRWGNRMPLMTRFLKKTSPDIMCLQEAHSNQSADIVKKFPVFGVIGAVNEKEKQRTVHNPILYRKDKFDIINSGSFALSEYPDSFSSLGWDAKYKRKATWTNLKYKDTGEIVFVLNAHLDNVGKVAREKGMKLILDKIRTLSNTKRIILAGDFNDISSSKAPVLASQWGLNDTYKTSPTIKGVNYTFHKFGQKKVGERYKIDYIFASKDFETVSVDIPKEKPKRGVYISDHNPVIVKMKF